MSVREGDNIFEVGAVLQQTLRRAGWEHSEIEHIMADFGATPNYDDAIKFARRYITIGSADTTDD